MVVAISVIFFLTTRLESRAPCRKEVRRRLRMKALRRRKRSHVWCCASEGVRKSLHEVWDLWSIRETRECSASNQETGAGGSRPNRKWWEKIFQFHKLKRTWCIVTRIEKQVIHEPSIHEKDLSVFAEQVGNGSIKTNVLTWWMFKTLSMKAAIHFGPNCVSNSEIYKNIKFEEIESVFNITQMLPMEHSEEILNVKCLEYSSRSWARSVLANDQAIKWTKAKVCVCADSVLCVGQMKDTPEAVERWERQVEGLRLNSSYQDAVGIDGEAIEFERKNFPGFSSLSIRQAIQQDLEKRKIQPEEFKDTADTIMQESSLPTSCYSRASSTKIDQMGTTFGE